MPGLLSLSWVLALALLLVFANGALAVPELQLLDRKQKDIGTSYSSLAVFTLPWQKAKFLQFGVAKFRKQLHT